MIQSFCPRVFMDGRRGKLSAAQSGTLVPDLPVRSAAQPEPQIDSAPAPQDDYDALLDELDGITVSPLRPGSRAPPSQPESARSSQSIPENILVPPSTHPTRSGSPPKFLDDSAGSPDPARCNKARGPSRSVFSLADSIGDDIEDLLGELDPGSPDASPASSSTEAPFAEQSGGNVCRVGMGACEEQGQRPSMEDMHIMMMSDFSPNALSHGTSTGVRAFCGVLDGHSGRAVADYAASRLPELVQSQPWYRNAAGSPAVSVVERCLGNAFETIDAEICEQTQSGRLAGGCTANVALLLDQHLYIANLGDTRAVLSRGGFAHEMSQDHKPDLPSERARIEALGGRVEWRGCWWVLGSSGAAAYRGLAVSRAFGDIAWKVPVPLVDPCPEVRSCRLKPEDEFLVIGCDGVWDVMTGQDAVDLARRHTSGGCAGPDGEGGVGDRAASAAAKEIASAALAKGSMDNITVVVMTLLRSC